MSEKKIHLYVNSQERTLSLHSLVELKNQLIQATGVDQKNSVLWPEHMG